MALSYPGYVERSDYRDEEQLTLAFENLEHMPPSFVTSFSRSIKILDLSHNSFSDFSFLKHFPQLSSLILDHNRVSSATIFPTLPSLKILWLNHNQISRLFPFIQRLKVAFPNLLFLSLMANEAVPVNLDESTFYQHLQYRLFVISWFPTLDHLDDQPVTDSERSEALRLYKRPLLERLANKEPIRKVFQSVSAALNLVQKQDKPGEFRSVFV